MKNKFAYTIHSRTFGVGSDKFSPFEVYEDEMTACLEECNIVNVKWNGVAGQDMGPVIFTSRKDADEFRSVIGRWGPYRGVELLKTVKV